MKFLSLQPFVPSGSDFQGSREFFLELGFTIVWEGVDYIGFQKDGCTFILQRFDDKQFADNFMINVKIENAAEFFNELKAKELEQKFGVRIGPPVQQSYGKEVNLIDMAGVCWHFVE